MLVADDDPVLRRLAQATLQRAGYTVQATGDGEAALRALQGSDPPLLAVLDWIMPGMYGVEICRQLRAGPMAIRPYVILLTSKRRSQDIVEGLAAGADDYIPKPFTVEELRARVQVGTRIVTLQLQLQERVRALEAALSQREAGNGIEHV
jgi:DNA-binding response OmpR family regulator